MTKKHQVKDVDGVIQRPRAVLSSPGMTIAFYTKHWFCTTREASIFVA